MAKKPVESVGQVIAGVGNDGYNSKIRWWQCSDVAWFYPARRKLVSGLVLIAVPLLTSSYFF